MRLQHLVQPRLSGLKLYRGWAVARDRPHLESENRMLPSPAQLPSLRCATGLSSFVAGVVGYGKWSWRRRTYPWRVAGQEKKKRRNPFCRYLPVLSALKKTALGKVPSKLRRAVSLERLSGSANNRRGQLTTRPTTAREWRRRGPPTHTGPQSLPMANQRGCECGQSVRYVALAMLSTAACADENHPEKILNTYKRC